MWDACDLEYLHTDKVMLTPIGKHFKSCKNYLSFASSPFVDLTRSYFSSIFKTLQ